MGMGGMGTLAHGTRRVFRSVAIRVEVERERERDVIYKAAVLGHSAQESRGSWNQNRHFAIGSYLFRYIYIYIHLEQ